MDLRRTEVLDRSHGAHLSICGTLRPANRGVMRPAEVAVLAVSDGSVLRRFQASCNVASGDRKGVQGTVE